MKVYIAINTPFSKDANPYISTLMNCINEQFKNIKWKYGIDVFWSNEILNYDIIYIHWPDALLYENRYVTHTSKELKKRITYLKNNKIKIVTTCHNFTPHYSHDKERINAYNYVYEQSNVILHLGKISLAIMQDKYPNIEHKLLPHHVYDTLYKEIPKREDAISKLNLNPNKKYILCFGAFRDDEERKLIINLSKKIRKKNFIILAPSFMRIPKQRNFLRLIKPYIKFFYYRCRYKGLKIYNGFVNDDLLALFYSVADLSLIHRVRILNSGNITLGFLMKKVVVGPNIGNVGSILLETGNPVFNPKNESSITEAINKGYELKILGKGDENYNYGLTYLSTKIIAERLYHIFMNLV